MIAVRPKPWTRHHTHRLFHISMGLVFAYIVGMLSSGLVVAWWQASASNDVAISANIGAVEPGPTIIVPPSGGSTPAPQEEIPKLANPELTVDPVTNPTEERYVESVNGLVKVFVFSTRRPLFRGGTNIPNALIFLEVHSGPILYGTTQADENGSWQWRTPEDLEPGSHKLLVTARDPNDASVFATASLDFFINPDAPSQEPKPIVPISNAFFKKLFGIFLTIPSEYRVVSAGDDVVASLRLYSQGEPSAKDIKYSVIGPDNDVVVEVAETLPPGEELAFRKTFITHPGAPSGLYTIQVKVPNLISTAVASDKFQILPPGEGLAGTTFLVTPLMVQMLLTLLLLFIILTLYAYRRVVVLNRTIRQHNLAQ